ncbi:MAG: thioredoxin [Candidatus Hydrogenedentota bacterium]
MTTNTNYLEIDGANFDSAVLKSRLPVLVAFATQWSRPCQVLNSVLEEIAASFADRLKVVRINADENPDLGLWYGIHAVPTLLYFVAGNVKCKIVGTATKAAILSRLEPLTSTQHNTGE